MAGFFLRRSSFLLPTSARRSSVASVRSFASSASASSFISKQTRSSLFVSTGVTAVAIALSSRLASRTTPTTNTRVHHSHTTATARANTPASCVVNHSNTGSTANHAAVNHAASFSSSSSSPSPSPASVPIFAFPCEKSALEVLYAQHAAPHCERAFAINDIGIVDRQFQRWTSQLPMVKPFYAVKCNPDPVLLKSLGAMGASFDCASGAEIAACLATGHVTNPQQQIIFANPIKNLRDLQYARKVGVTKMTFDNVDELYKIKQHHPEAELVLRLLPDDSGSLMRFGVKFGAPTANIPRILATVKELGLKLIGCSFHIGSGCFDANKYYGAIQLAHSVFQQAEAAGLPKLQLLDLGGGFPGNPVPHARTPAEGGHLTPAFEEFATVIRRGLRDFFPPESGVTVMAEPGRYMATAWSTLFTLIQGKREEPVAANAPKKFLYYINDGVYGSFNCIMFDHAHPVPVPATQFMSDKVSVIELEQQKLQQQQQIALHGTRRLSLQSLKRAPMAVSSMSVASSPTAVAERQQHIRATHSDASSTSAAASSASSPAVCYGTFFGPTCDSMDVVATDFPLTDELCVGDWLAFEQFGAYTSAASSTFNGMERPDHYYVRSARPSPNAHF